VDNNHVGSSCLRHVARPLQEVPRLTRFPRVPGLFCWPFEHGTVLAYAPGMAQPPKLLDRVRSAIRTRHYSRRTEEAYVAWIRRFIVFHRKTHPTQMGASEIAQFLTWGHRDVRTTMTYLHVMNRGALGVKSPIDRL